MKLKLKPKLKLKLKHEAESEAEAKAKAEANHGIKRQSLMTTIFSPLFYAMCPKSLSNIAIDVRSSRRMDPKRGPNSPPSLFRKLHCRWWLVDLQLITDLERTSVFQDWKFERSNLHRRDFHGGVLLAVGF